MTGVAPAVPVSVRPSAETAKVTGTPPEVSGPAKPFGNASISPKVTVGDQTNGFSPALSVGPSAPKKKPGMLPDVLSPGSAAFEPTGNERSSTMSVATAAVGPSSLMPATKVPWVVSPSSSSSV